MKIKFDYEKYCTGKYDVQTESGHKVHKLVKFDTIGDWCLYGTVNHIVFNWSIKGKLDGPDMISPDDLVLIKKGFRVFKNVYENEAGQYYLGNQNFNSEHEAHVALRKITSARYIQTIEIIDEL